MGSTDRTLNIDHDGTLASARAPTNDERPARGHLLPAY
jgi:hypothetical protein